MKRVERIREYLEGLDDSSLLSIWNEYCGNDDCVYPMDELDELLGGMAPSEILRASYYGYFNPNDDYFKYNSRGNLVSTNSISEWIDIEELAMCIDENEKDFGDSQIRHILGDDYDEEDEE